MPYYERRTFDDRDPGMDDPLPIRLARIIEAVQIQAVEVLFFDGIRYTFTDETGSYPSSGQTIHPLVDRLQELLYTRCYCRGFVSGQTLVPSGQDRDPAFLRRLFAAAWCRDQGNRKMTFAWVQPSGQFAVRTKGQFTDTVDHDGYPADTVSVLSDRSTDASGDTPAEPVAEPMFIRIYFNLQAQGAVPLASSLCQTLSRCKIPFVFKCPGHPARYDRRDAGVLYLRSQDYHRTAVVLASIHTDLSPFLNQGTPLFTKPLAHGIGLAEEPVPSRSFGRHRCLLLAEGLRIAFEQGKTGMEDRLEVIRQTFIGHGLRLDAPHLNPGSMDRYDPLMQDAEGL